LFTFFKGAVPLVSVLLKIQIKIYLFFAANQERKTSEKCLNGLTRADTFYQGTLT